MRSPVIGYLVHDLSDSTTAKRVAMLSAGGARVALAGFHRTAAPPGEVAGVRPLSLGRTHDGRMMNRTLMVARARAMVPRLAAALGPMDAILARNLEMLALAVALAERTPAHPPVAYELLDVHRLLVSPQVRGAALRYLEARLATHARLLVTSSPAFVENYVAPLSGVRLPVRLVENKVLPDVADLPCPPRPAGPPWRIGLFGALRCRRSVDVLLSAARRLGGRLEVVVRGRPSPAVFEDLPAEIAAAPHAAFLGPYEARQLPAIYADVHFAWAVDFYEEGENSAWLRPCRLYEGAVFGAVPVVAAGTETARFCTRLGIGVALADDFAEGLVEAMEAMSAAAYAERAARVAAVPRERLVATRRECAALVEALVGEGEGARAA